MYLFPFFLAFKRVSSLAENQKFNLTWLIVGVIYSLLIGYRHEVGGDWYNYIRILNRANVLTFNEVLSHGDPGYYLLNMLLGSWDFHIYAVNLVCGAIFMMGLITFARRQPNPWLAIAVAVPYIIVVMAMGYTRQAVALGFVFLGLVSLEKSEFKKFIIMIALAVTFHKSAVLLIGLGMFLQGNGKFIRFFAVVIVGFAAWSAFVADYQQQLWNVYVTEQMQSQGAVIRVTMNFLPSLLFFVLRKQWKKEFKDYSFWAMLALGSIISFFFVNFASTAVDRIALYFTPIQVIVYARLPYMLRTKYSEKVTTSAILVVYLMVLYVWLNYAVHSRFWVPYNNLIFN